MIATRTTNVWNSYSHRAADHIPLVSLQETCEGRKKPTSPVAEDAAAYLGPDG